MRTTLIKWAASLVIGGTLASTALLGMTTPLGTLEACHTLELPENGPQVDVDGLKGQGWYSDPTDHAERLYAPSCRH